MVRRKPRSVITTVVATVIVAAVAGLLLVGCGDSVGNADPGSGGSGSGNVIATTTIWADVVNEVACRKVAVPSLIPAGADAHTFEPSVQAADRLLGADLVFTNGLGLEGDLKDTISAAKDSGVEVVELAPGMEPIGEDPHVWMDPDRVAMAVPVIEKHLAGIRDLGVTRSELARCAGDYVSRLHELSDSMSSEMASLPASARKLVTNHENLGYFADRFDFQVVGALIPSTSTLGESDPRTLDELSATVKSAGVRSIFVEATGSHRLANTLAERLGSGIEVQELFAESLGTKSQGADTYIDMMSVNANRIAKSLSR
ncbi:MAG TPA: metal ABC transporter substrate-binding protein [Microthrixaceae bacterium]|nr:metal ABC transporter substrate-binding protein [Microthrixaceae bacterium]